MHGLTPMPLGVEAPERRMILDCVRTPRLGDSGRPLRYDRGAGSDDVDHHVGCKLRAIVCGQLATRHDSIRIFAMTLETPRTYWRFAISEANREDVPARAAVVKRNSNCDDDCEIVPPTV